MAVKKKKAAKKKAAAKKKPPKVIIEVHLSSGGRVSNALAARTLSGLRLFEAATDDQVSIEVKILILGVAGNQQIKPGELPDSFRLVEDLGYNDQLLDALHATLNNYVSHKKPGARISQKEMDDCELVGDCVSLVKQKIS